MKNPDIGSVTPSFFLEMSGDAASVLSLETAARTGFQPFNAALFRVAAGNGDIGLLCRLQQFRQQFWGVLQVGVDHAQQVRRRLTPAIQHRPG